MELLTILLLLAAILQTRISNLRLAINVVLVQSVIVAMACVIIGMQTHEVHMFIAALLTSAIKVGIIPFALNCRPRDCEGQFFHFYDPAVYYRVLWFD